MSLSDTQNLVLLLYDWEGHVYGIIMRIAHNYYYVAEEIQ